MKPTVKVFGLSLLAILVALSSPAFHGAAARSADPAEALSVAQRAGDWTLAERTDRAVKITTMALSSWRRLKAKYGTTGPGSDTNNIDQTYEWNDDNCSVPDSIGDTAAYYEVIFRTACERHDFGYRNLGNGVDRTPWRGALVSTNGRKNAVDKKFLKDMNQICEEEGQGNDCTAAAQSFYLATNRSEEGHNAWHRSECHDGMLCLFEDRDFKHKRVMLPQDARDLSTVGLNNNAESYKNLTLFKWRLYDKTDFQGRSVCLPRGLSESGMTHLEFADKASSADKTDDTNFGNC